MPRNVVHMSRTATRLAHLVVLSVCVGLLGSCAGGGGTVEPAAAPPAPVTDLVRDTPIAPAPPSDTAFDTPVPRAESPADASWAERTLASLTLRQKVGQMIMPFVLGDYAPEGSESHDKILALIENDEVGGLIVSLGAPADVALKLNDFQRHSRLPLLVGADMETGAGFRFRGAVHLPGNVPLGGATELPPPMAVGATGDAGLAYEMGRITALEARAVGVHVPFAPVLDVNSNPDNPIINTRSFGESPAEVARLGVAFIRGVQEAGSIATAKHFPGHGDTETDSHNELPIIRTTRAHLDSTELVPFRAAVAAGVGAIMTAHIAVPSLNGGGESPSTLSPAVLTGLLKGEMAFDGLVFTDAMDMAAIDRRFPRGEASVRAVLAGADVVLMPPDVADALEGIVGAVLDGRLSEARIDESVLKVLKAKEAQGLDRERTVSLEQIPHIVGIPTHIAVADEIARRSITLLRDERRLLPLLGTRSARVLSISLRRTADLQAGRIFNAALRNRYPSLVTAELDRNARADVFAELLRQGRRSDLVVVSLYVNWSASTAAAPLSDEAVAFLHDLAESGVPHLVISFGNPYLLREMPAVRAYMLAWSGSESSQKAAAGALFGDAPISGRTPIQLPPYFGMGNGLSPTTGSGRDS